MSDQQKTYAEMSDSEKKKEDWMNSKWRPAMGWLYMLVCLCDFVVFPVLWAVLHAVMHSTNVQQWQPLTLQGAGLFHLAMGAVLGLAAWGRTQEKLGGANNGGLSAPSTGFGVPSPAPSSFAAPTASSFGATGAAGGFSSSGFGSVPSPAPAPSFSGGFGNSGAVTTTASGKKIVPVGDEPVL